MTVVPDKVNLSFDSVPSGLTLEIDGISKQTPFVFGDVKGFQHTINAPPQSNGGNAYTFSSWSDGGAQSHGIVVPNTNQSYIATFQASAGPPNLAGAWAFNEGLGTTAADASGNGNTGAIGTASWITTGKFGNGLSFNGTTARVTVPDSNSLDLTTGMTLEAWVYPTAGGNWRDVIYKGPDDIYYLEGSSTGGPPAVGGTFASPLAGASALPLNTWSHVAGTYDGTTLRLYVNGVQVSSRPLATQIATSTGALSIGGDALYGQYFAGRIDEIRIYNTALGGGRDPGGHEHADRPARARHAAADGPDRPHGERGQPEPDQPGLERLDRQRRRHRLPGRALPGRRLLQLRPGRDPARHLLQRHRPDPVDELQLPRARGRRRRQPERVLGRAERDHAGGARHAAAHGPDRADGDGGLGQPDQPGLERLDRQRRRHRLPGRALPGRRLLQLPPDRDPDGHDLQRHRPDPATSYSYRVRATDAAGNLSPYSACRAPATPDTQPPTAPTGLTASAASPSQINLAWSASTDNVGVTGYRVERCQGAGCSNFVQVATPPGTSFNDTGLTPSTSYSYRVRAADAAGNLSAYSGVQSATTPAVPDTQPPTAPTGLTATAVSGSQINLAWSASTDNVGVTGYRVERCQGAGCSNFLQVATPTGTAFNDTGLTPVDELQLPRARDRRRRQPERVLGRAERDDASGGIAARSGVCVQRGNGDIGSRCLWPGQRWHDLERNVDERGQVWQRTAVQRR